MVLVLLALSIQFISNILKPNFIGDVYNTIDAFYDQPDNSMEVMVYGSSHAWKGFDTEELEKNYGVRSWNYGANWQYINTTELFLEDSLLSQSPKVALIEAFHIDYVHADTVLDGEIMYTNHLRWSEAKLRYIIQVFGKNLKEYFSYFFPLVYYHGNWNSLNHFNFINDTDDYDYVKARGFLSYDDVVPITIPDYREFEQYPLCDDALATLDRMVASCKERGIQVVFFLVPWEGEFNYRDALAAYAEENGCYYVDLFEHAETAKLDGATDFQDSGHLNDSGAKKVANYMGQYLYENLGIGNPVT